MLREVEAAVASSDEVEAGVIGLPEGPTGFGGFGDELFELAGGGVVFPDLAGTSALIALAPPGFAFAGEEEALAVRGDGGFGGVVVEEKGFGFGSGDIEEGEANGA